MIKKEIDYKFINILVQKGLLPLAYYGCRVEEFKVKEENVQLNTKYQHRFLLRKSSGKIVSKIFKHDVS